MVIACATKRVPDFASAKSIDSKTSLELPQEYIPTIPVRYLVKGTNKRDVFRYLIPGNDPCIFHAY